MSVSHKARKRFGQNFLTDNTVIDRIIHSIHPQHGDLMVEIGPGLGALTCPLLRRLGKLHVVELDRDIIPKLSQACGRFGELHIHNQDVLEFDFAGLTENSQPLRIVGNLPYNISTPILFHLIKYGPLIRDMHFMLQKEVVERMAAEPGGHEYGRLSVMLQYHCEVWSLFNVPSHAFRPQPKVESAIVRLVPHARAPVLVDDYTLFEQVVKQAFSQRRKTLRNTLKTICDADIIESAGIDPGLRPEQLTLTQYVELCNRINRTEQVTK